MSPEELQQQHDRILEACRHQFIETPKMGGDIYSSNYLTKLEEQIAEAYTNFVKINESKHLLNAYRTPAVLATVMVLSYLISSVLDFIGIESLSRTAVIGLYLPLALVAVWVYARYSGNLRSLGQMIDKVTEMCWDEVRRVTSHFCNSVTCSILYLVSSASLCHADAEGSPASCKIGR